MTENIIERKTALSVIDISKEFEKGICGGAISLSGVSFSFGEKGVHGILGPRGSGKSMLAAILSGSIPPDSGSVMLFESDIFADSKAAKRKIGYVPESPSFYPDMTVAETLLFVGASRKVESAKLVRQIKEALSLTGLDALENRLVKKLTKTEKKLLAYSASVLGNPDVIIIDEICPMAEATEQFDFVELIKMLGRKKTVIIATEDYDVAEALCEDIVIISDGCVLANGKIDELNEKLIKSDARYTSLEALYRDLVAASKIVPDKTEE